jgi:hypothetical protein
MAPRPRDLALLLATLGSGVLSGACAGDSVPEQPAEWNEADGYRWRELAVPDRGQPGFRPLAPARTGVSFANAVSDELILENEFLSNGSGVAIGDVDGDGLADVYLARIEGPNALYRNLGDWRFEDVAQAAGVDAPDRYSTGAVLVDADGDRDLDLLLTALGGPNSLFLNDGRGRFVDATDESGLASDRGSTTSALADVDGDGDLDLYVANYKRVAVTNLLPPEERTMSRTVMEVDGEFVVRPEFREHYMVVWRGNQLRRFHIGEPDHFYLNDGAGHFERFSLASERFLDASGRPLPSPPPDWGLSARFHDLDGDGDPDLYVCNDFETPDRIWLNEGDGTFRAVPRSAIRTTAASCMAVDFADVDLDGDLDIFAADMLSREGTRRRRQLAVVLLESHLPGEDPPAQQLQRNVLLVNRGDDTFAEAAHYAGIAASGWSWSVVFVDADLDGYEDLLIPNGHLHDVMDADTQRELQEMLLEDWRQHLLFYRRLPLHNVVFRNEGDLRFTDVGREWGFGAEEDITNSLAVGDLDGDGDPDVVANRMDRPALVLRNESTAPRVAIRLEGRSPNTQGIGAVIRVLGGVVPEARKEVTAGGLYLSGSEAAHAFGTGEAEDVTIVVEWRSGARTRIEGAGPNRMYIVREPELQEALDAAAEQPPAVTAVESALEERPLFEEGVALDHLHVELPYGDFNRQPLLPMRLSQLGPGVAWVDVDRDDDPDLLVGTGRGGTLSLFRNDDGRFQRLVLRMPDSPLDQSTVLELPDAAGTSLLIGQMNYEAPDPNSARTVPAVVQVRLDPRGLAGDEALALTRAAVPGDPGAAGALALADYDGDGDLDLFVGGRTRPAEYPRPTSARLFQNEEGRFVLDEANVEALQDVGLVSSAVFSDVDGDADPDLLLALDWGPVRLFRNEQGRYRDETATWGLAEHTGRWNGIATGDLDGDGRLDAVVTAWGRNTGLPASREHPLKLYYGDFDADGTLDVLQATYDEHIDGYATTVSFDRLRGVLPFVRTRLDSYTAYANANVEQTLGSAFDRAESLEAASLEHVLLLNRGERFERIALPGDAQLAPAFHVGIADLDGDGSEDVFLTQNFVSVDPDTPRLQAGRGLWLKGDGAGGLTAIPGQQSGIRLYGEGRGAAFADYDGDGRLDVAVSQNAGPARLLRNRGAKPGLRVRVAGPPANPAGVGVVLRVEYESGLGPVREVKAGSGYWSQDELLQVLGLRDTPVALRARWPHGGESRHEIRAGTRDIRVEWPGDTP